MKNLFNLRLVRTSILALSVCMAACTEEDKEMSGPEILNEEYRNGFIKGSLSGTRKDGVAFSGDFNFIRNYDKEIIFYQDENSLDDVQYVYLNWENDKNYNSAEIRVDIKNKGKENEEVSLGYFEIDYSKPLENRTVFQLEAESDFRERNMFFPVAPSYTDYKFVFDFSYSSTGFNNYYDHEIGQYYYYVKDHEGNTIYFEDTNKYSTQDPQTGEHYTFGKFAYMINSAGEKSTTSQLYGDLRLRSKVSNNGYALLAIFDKKGVDLSETITIVDKQKVSNFKYDEATGLLSFDYEVTLDKYSQYNSSKNEVKIQGKVEVTVTYDKMINHTPTQEVL